MSPYLIIVRAGAKSRHLEWLHPASDRNFDVLVSAYAEAARTDQEEGVWQVLIPGSKVYGWRRTLELEWDRIRQYECVALIDDDISTDSSTLSRCFAIGNAENLSIWQPALSVGSHFSYAGTLANPLFRLRYVNYIEMMCPFFRVEALRLISQLFSYGFESGLDLVWCSAVESEGENFAIIDATSVLHTRAVGVEKEANGFWGRDYEDDIYACLKYFGIPWPSLVSRAGVTNKGVRVRRAGVLLRTTYAALLLFLRGMRKDESVRILKHLRHQAFAAFATFPRVRRLLSKDLAEGVSTTVAPR